MTNCSCPSNPSRRRAATLTGAGLLATLLPAAGRSVAADVDRTSDRLDTPPRARSYASPSGRFRLELELAQLTPPWRVDARLLAVDPTGQVSPRTLWQQRLPHDGGPRHALVSDRGAVVLLDDWIHIPSPRAVMLLAGNGQILASYSIEQVIERVQRQPREVTDAARFGNWLSEEARLAQATGPVLLRCAGRGLTLDLDNGRLASVD